MSRSETAENGVVSAVQCTPPSGVASSGGFPVGSVLNTKPCNESANRMCTAVSDVRSTWPSAVHVAPPSVVSAMVPFVSSTKPCVGDTKVADSAGGIDAVLGAVVVVVVLVLGTVGLGPTGGVAPLTCS